MISRSAFCTFAARGWCSPVSLLRQVRLAVGSQLFAMPIPLLREFLLACGCIPADRASMLNALHAGRSLAVTPGGWREGQFFGSYKLVLKQRRGFVQLAQLAQQSGALLVPVLCLGEQDVATALAPGPLLWGYRFLQTFRPHPVKVVFGKVRLQGYY
jgi:1-acyl-sn-glycerol-3-phosphate acyltransferase